MASFSFSVNSAGLSHVHSILQEALVRTATEILSRERNDAVIPFNTGNLQNDSTYVDTSGAARGSVPIVSDTPYAARLYFHPEYSFRNGRRGEWWEPWISGSRSRDPQTIFAAQVRSLMR